MGNVRRVRLAGRETKKRRALDPKKDFNSPTRTDPREAEQLTNEQLAADNPAAEMPVMVKNGRMAVTYVKPHFDCDKNDKRTVEFEISVPLNKQLAELVPTKMREEWEYLVRRGNKNMTVCSASARITMTPT